MGRVGHRVRRNKVAAPTPKKNKAINGENTKSQGNAPKGATCCTAMPMAKTLATTHAAMRLTMANAAKT